MLLGSLLAMGIGVGEPWGELVPAPTTHSDVAPDSVRAELAAVPASAVPPTTTTPSPATTTSTTTTAAPTAGSGGDAGPVPPPPGPAPAEDPLPMRPPYVVAMSSAPVAVHDSPDEGSSARLLDPATEVAGQLVFLVKHDGADWLEVFLPIRPNGSTGWLRAGDVELYEHDYRIELFLSQRRLVLFEGSSVVLDEPIGVGAEQTPTPGGTYYLKELLRPPDPGGFYGPYAYGLSGFSNVLTDFAGGEGVIGLHGTNDPSSVGRNVSNGCIRLRNATITRLVEDIGLPLGTPVLVRA